METVCAWWCRKWISGALGHYRTCLPGFWTIFDRFGHLLGPFYGSSLALCRQLLDHFWTKIGSFLGDFGRFLGSSGVILGSLYDHFGIILASFLGRFGAFLTLLTGFRPKPGQFGVLCQKMH